MNDARKEELASVLNKMPEVRWDRMFGGEGESTVFGWLDRDDSHEDFVIVTFRSAEDFSFTTSSAQWSPIFSDRLFGEGQHTPCDRVEEILEDRVQAVHLVDPMDAGGEIAGPDTEGFHAVTVDLHRAVLVDGIAVVAVHLQRGTDIDFAIGLLIEGDINQSDPAEHARVLNLMGWEELAGIITEIEATAKRLGYAEDLSVLLKRRRKQLEEEGAI